MKYRCVVLFGALAAVVAVASVPMVGQAQRDLRSPAVPMANHPRTPWGDPDLQGNWETRGRVNFERLDEHQGKELLTDVEVAELQGRTDERQDLALAGKATNRGFRAQENYNSIFNTQPGRQSINPRTSAIVDPPDGRLPPWTMEQAKLWDEREAVMVGRGEAASAQDVNSGGRCLPTLGPPQVGAWGLGFGGEKSGYGGRDADGENLLLTNGDGFASTARGGGNRILQVPGWVVINATIIPVDGRPAPSPQSIRQLTGVARGRWDGNTLVVEYTNIRYPAYPFIPAYTGRLYPGTAETLKLTERYTRTGPDDLEYRYTVEDPAVYTRPYTVMHGLQRNDTPSPGAPRMCHENNRDMGGVLSNQRADEHLSLETGIYSQEMRRPRVEQLKQDAEEAATKRQSSSSR